MKLSKFFVPLFTTALSHEEHTNTNVKHDIREKMSSADEKRANKVPVWEMISKRNDFLKNLEASTRL